MRKTKILAFIALIPLFAANNFGSALAMEKDYSITGINLSEATFEADIEGTKVETNEAAELKESLELLRAELAEIKSGVKQLQAKVVEAEMEKLSNQLAVLQKEIVETQKVDFEKTEIPKFEFDFDLIPARQTPQVTKIEDFVGFDLKKEISKSEDTETTKETATTETEEDSELVEKLEAAEAEIEELKAALAEKEELEKDKAAHAEVIGKAEEIKIAKKEFEKVAVEDAVEKLKKEGEAKEIEAKEIEKTSNIIVKANGKILFQFPRSLSRKSREAVAVAKNKTLTAENLKADALEIEQPTPQENNFKRSSAPKKELFFFSTCSIAILGGMFGIAIAVFIVWLIRHERRLLAATSRHFQQLDFKPDFELNSCAKKLFQLNKKSSFHKKTSSDE